MIYLILPQKGYFKKNKNINGKKSFNRNDFNKIFNLDKKLNSNLIKVINSTYHRDFSNVYKLGKYKITIDENNKVLIIAEIGVNHNGKLEFAKKLMLKAKKSGLILLNFNLLM